MNQLKLERESIKEILLVILYLIVVYLKTSVVIKISEIIHKV